MTAATATEAARTARRGERAEAANLPKGQAERRTCSPLPAVRGTAGGHSLSSVPTGSELTPDHSSRNRWLRPVRPDRRPSPRAAAAPLLNLSSRHTAPTAGCRTARTAG